MPKGATCPACGEQTWHKTDRGSRRCSNQECQVIGWLGGETPTGGGGQGKECTTCGTQTLVRVDDGKNGPEIRRCTGCAAVVVFPN